MKRPLPIAIVSILLVVLGVLGAITLAMPDFRADMLHLLAVAIRYAGMLIAGVGLWFLYKWGFFVYLGLWIVQLGLFFALYGGVAQHSLGWLSWVGPIVVSAAVLPYWKQLR